MYPEERERLRTRRRILKKINFRSPKHEKESIYSQIGFRGLFDVVYHSSPKLLFPISIPYGLDVYGKILRGSTNLDDVLRMHENEYIDSIKFRALRPKYRKVKTILKNKYAIN